MDRRRLAVIVLLVGGAGGVATACDEPRSSPDDGPEIVLPPRPDDRGGGDASPDAPASCLAPRIACPEGCVDPTSAPSSCGRCGHDCLGGACTGGVCEARAISPPLGIPQTVATMLGAVFATVYVDGKVVRIPAGGGALAEIATGASRPWGIAVDPDGEGGTVAFGEARTGGVARVSTGPCGATGCGAIAAIATAEDDVRYLAFDRGGSLYWTSASGAAGGRVRKKVGAAPPTDLFTGETAAYGILVAGSTLVFGRHEAIGRVRRASTTGTNAIDLVTNVIYPEGLASDGTDLWIADSGGNRIARCAISGCGGVASTFAHATNPHGVAIDDDNVYWTNGLVSGGSVAWCPKRGCPASGPATLAGSQENPYGIAADGVAVYWANSAPGGAVMRAPKP